MIKQLTFLFMLLLVSRVAKADPIAGEMSRKSEEMTPYVILNPEHNVTDILPPSSKSADNPDIYFTADELIFNEEKETLEAVGDVVISRENLKVFADKIVYNKKNDTIEALGHVKLEEADGTTVFADEVNLTSKLTRAEMTKIVTIMRDGSRLWAEHFHKKENNNKVMRNVIYTPCDCCTADFNKAPLWRIRARKVTHDAQNKNMNYNHAFLDIKDVPVLYTPFLSHPDPTVKRRSGFLAPKIGKTSYLGGTFEAKYFWNINEHSDILFSPIITANKGIVWGGRYRGYTQNAYIEATGTYLHDDNDERAEHRSNLFSTMRYEINDLWVASSHINYASDSLYLKELSLDKDDEAWLTSDVALERFSGQNYTSLEAYYYKLISYNLRENDADTFERMKYDKPLVAPLFESEWLTEPDKFGSYFKNEFGLASVYHAGGVQSHRLSMINAWNLPWTSPFGERYKITGSVKTDAYDIKEYHYQQGKKSYDGTPTRVFPQLGIEWKLPFIKASETSRQIIEPVVVGVLAPNGGNKSSRIPNEDSQDLHLEDTNILDLDRYAGYDRNDNGSRISYGFNWSSYGNVMGRTSAFLAQTYQFNKKTSFTESTDSTGHLSDYVGRIYAAPSSMLDLTYRFRLDRQDYKLTYSELASSIGTNMLNLYVSYIYLQKNDKASELMKTRQELYTGIHAALTRDWSIDIYNRVDLAKNGCSLEHGGNLIYEDECFKFVTTVKKYTSNDPDLDDSYEFNFSFYLKTLGGLGS
ncbi:MAG: LPS-assembly protein LptD [Alphaproteobacteria bacterium]|nr:LPS-assembly protein LptD [Alphaproteobacteria bacterium]